MIKREDIEPIVMDTQNETQKANNKFREEMRKAGMTDKEKLFSAIYECCSELKELSFGCKVLWLDDEFKITDKDGNFYTVVDNEGHRKVITQQMFDHMFQVKVIGHPIQLEHLLRTTEAMGKKIVIDVWGNVMEIIGENEHGINLNTPICRVNLTKSVEEQEEATLIQLAKVIL